MACKTSAHCFSLPHTSSTSWNQFITLRLPIFTRNTCLRGLLKCRVHWRCFHVEQSQYPMSPQVAEYNYSRYGTSGAAYRVKGVILKVFIGTRGVRRLSVLMGISGAGQAMRHRRTFRTFRKHSAEASDTNGSAILSPSIITNHL